MSESKAYSKSSVVITVIVVIALGLWLLNQKNRTENCTDRASAAAVETYPFDEYPNTSERSTLQESYKLRYMESCR